ncbi:urease subunit beta [Desulfovibrio sp. ZJ746]|uniref:urease subunit beta n=1 Tax=unclassified Desulfovibrio TaxID=2593640 RepID=UPI00321699A4
MGGVILADGDITYNAHRRTAKVVVHNTGDRPVQVGSHFHFFEVNRYLEFDRPAAFGKHLNIPATTAIRFEPGEEKEVELVAFGGKRRLIGFNDLTDGYAGLEDDPTYYPVKIRAFKKMAAMGFKSVSESEADAEVNEAELSAKAKGGK